MRILTVFMLLLLASCANIVPPTGGPQDTSPPKLRSVAPPDSQFNARVTKIVLGFDEFITLDNPGSNVQLSPLLPVPLDVSYRNRSVTVRIPDSLLEANTTYRLSFGTAIRDVHEGNVFSSYAYTFSTGPYFDSLSIAGHVLDAASGLPDTAALIVLYPAASPDSAVFRSKPRYAVHVDNAGAFLVSGLPARPFRLFAIRDANNNLSYDGPPEAIAFLDSAVVPGPESRPELDLRSFIAAGKPDTSATRQPVGFRKQALVQPQTQPYLVLADTTNPGKRTKDITQPLRITFAAKPDTVFTDKIFLFADSAGILSEQSITVAQDTAGAIVISTRWLEDARYELRLQKGFGLDSAGAELLPGRYPFRTRRAADYARMTVSILSAFSGPDWLLRVSSDKDTVWQRPILDTTVVLTLLEPGQYQISLIHDENRNGLWDTGDFILRKQPELVLPGLPQQLKAGWEHRVDFVPPRQRKGGKWDKVEGK